MRKVYLANVIGAPSPTAIIILEEAIDKINWQQVAFETYYFLQSKQVDFSKLAIINLRNKSTYNFKFVQIKNRNSIIELETNVNCGNSMFASARVVYMLDEKQQGIRNSISLTNVDTKLEISIEKRENYFDAKFNSLCGKTINSAKLFEGSEAITINESFGNINASIIDIVNPYIIVNAKEFGVNTITELLVLGDEDTDVLRKVKKVREDIIKKNKLKAHSEFPKIAVVLNDNGLAARTIYLDSWHTGLPITAVISIAVTSKMRNSVIYSPHLIVKEILTPKGRKRVNVKTNSEGLILGCEVFGIKAEGKIETYIYDN